MSRATDPIEAAVDSWAEAVRRTTEHPELSTLLAHRDGRLAAVEREAFLEHVAACSDCAWELRELMLEPSDSGILDRDAPSPDTVRRIRRAIVGAADGGAPVVRVDERGYGRVRWERVYAIAATLAVLALGTRLVLHESELSRAREPVLDEPAPSVDGAETEPQVAVFANAPILDLTGSTGEPTRGGVPGTLDQASRATLSAGGDGIVILLAADRSNAERFSLEIVDAQGDVVFTVDDLERVPPLDLLTTVLPRDLLPRTAFSLRLREMESSSTAIVHEVRITHGSAEHP